MSMLKRVRYYAIAIALSTEQTFKTGVVSPFTFPDVEILVQRLMNQPQEINLHPRNSLKGLWANLPINITEEEITEARQEMWNFSTDIQL